MARAEGRNLGLIEAEDIVTRPGFAERHRKLLLGCLAVVLFFAAWQALFLVVPFNALFISKPSLILGGLLDLIATGQLFHDLRGQCRALRLRFHRRGRRRRGVRRGHGLARTRRLRARSR